MSSVRHTDRPTDRSTDRPGKRRNAEELAARHGVGAAREDGIGDTPRVGELEDGNVVCMHTLRYATYVPRFLVSGFSFPAAVSLFESAIAGPSEECVGA